MTLEQVVANLIYLVYCLDASPWFEKKAKEAPADTLKEFAYGFATFVTWAFGWFLLIRLILWAGPRVSFFP